MQSHEKAALLRKRKLHLLQGSLIWTQKAGKRQMWDQMETSINFYQYLELQYLRLPQGGSESYTLGLKLISPLKVKPQRSQGASF